MILGDFYEHLASKEILILFKESKEQEFSVSHGGLVLFFFFQMTLPLQIKFLLQIHFSSKGLDLIQLRLLGAKGVMKWQIITGSVWQTAVGGRAA